MVTGDEQEQGDMLKEPVQERRSVLRFTTCFWGPCPRRVSFSGGQVPRCPTTSGLSPLHTLRVSMSFLANPFLIPDSGTLSIHYKKPIYSVTLGSVRETTAFSVRAQKSLPALCDMWEHNGNTSYDMLWVGRSLFNRRTSAPPPQLPSRHPEFCLVTVRFAPRLTFAGSLGRYTPGLSGASVHHFPHPWASSG